MVDETQQPAVAKKPEYQTLGHKTYVLFLLDYIQTGAFLLLVAIGLFILSAQSFLAKAPVPNLAHYVTLAGWVALGLSGIALLVAFLITGLIYRNYVFMLDEDALKIKRGVLNKEEIAIPYRQIQDVDINRDLNYQILGMSRVLILTAGHDDEKKEPDDSDSEGIIPAMDKDLAEWLQGELLKRTDVQKVTEVKS